MKRNTLLLSGVLAFQLVFALTLFVGGTDYGAFKAKEPLLSFDSKTVDEIVIDENAANSVMLTKKDDHWIIPAFGDFRADDRKVKNLLKQLETLKKSWPVATTGDAAKRFKLTEKSHKRRVILKSDGKVLTTLYFGTSPIFRKVHARIAGDDNIYNVGFSSNNLPTRGEGWVDYDVLAVPQDKIASITVDGVTLENENGRFAVAGLGADEQAMPRKIRSLVSAVVRPNFDVIQAKGKEEVAKLGKPDIQITVKRKSGPDVVYSYKREKEGGAYRYVVSGQDYVFRVAEKRIPAIIQAKRNTLVKKIKKPEEKAVDKPEDKKPEKQETSNTPKPDNQKETDNKKPEEKKTLEDTKQ
jgi:hypothetical protein